MKSPDKIKALITLLKESTNIDLEEAAGSVYRILLSFVPGGSIPSEVMGYHSALKQKRINQFAEFLQLGFENAAHKEFDPDNLKTDDFIDAFEEIVKGVLTSKTESKLKRFSNILVKQMYEPDGSEMFLKHVALIDSLNDIQVVLLDEWDEKMRGSELIHKLAAEKQEGDEKVRQLGGRTPLKNPEILLKHPREELIFYIYELTSLGLLSNEITFDNSFQSNSFARTIIGDKFLEFIDEFGRD